MSSTFKFHSTINEVVPWQAQYAFPTQSTKIAKQTVKLVPKNGNTFGRNQVVRIEFPAENYLNVFNSVLQFDVALTPPTALYGFTATAIASDVRTQWFIARGQQTALNPVVGAIPTASVRGVYAGHPVRLVVGGGTYWNVIDRYDDDGTNATISFTQPWPVAGEGGVVTIFPQVTMQNGGAHCFFSRLRVMYGSLVLEDIQEYHTLVRMLYEVAVQRDYAASQGQILDGMAGSTPLDYGAHSGKAGYGSRGANISSGGGIAQSLLMPGLKRTFCLNLLSGLLSQKKLVPLKWMASQLVIELTVSNELDALVGSSGATAGTPVAAPSSLKYDLTDVNFVAELLEFDSAFDTAFWGGLQQMGVPLKFASWHFHSFPMSGTNQTFQIHERSRSVKAAFAVARTTQQASAAYDSDRFFSDLGQTFSATGQISHSSVVPIESFQWRVGGRYYPAQPVRCLYGASEAYLELSKALDNLGDYTRGSKIDAYKWAAYYTDAAADITAHTGGEAFIMACGFENTDVSPGTIAGINAEEQSDIALNVKCRGSNAPVQKKLDIFMYFDALLVVRPGNNVELIM